VYVLCDLYVNMPSTSYMTCLPEELVDLILQFSDYPTLQTLCLVSKTVSRIATAHLYTSITLTGNSFAYLRPLALLLWTSPKHARLVRRISVSRAYGGNLVPWPEYNGLDDVIEQQVGMYVREGEKEKWIEDLMYGRDALFVAGLLVRSLPNVDRMGFDGFELVDPWVKYKV
jgi:hypothetical protein